MGFQAFEARRGRQDAVRSEEKLLIEKISMIWEEKRVVLRASKGRRGEEEERSR